ncbi:MAG: Mth938-like domain-containing protein [Sneathiella sp.]|nr:Mth938-like domain-containing protein [Sneathiella sp.]
MQDISGIPEEGQQLVNSYGDGGFRVSGVRFDGNIIILPNETSAWDIGSIKDLTIESLEPIINATPPVEILLIGCGASMAFIEEDIRKALRAKGITIDSMDSGAAVRTYNVLLLERRRVAVALIAS